MRSLRFDFELGNKGFLLSRYENPRARAWLRRASPDTPIRLTSRDERSAEYGGVDPQIDYPEVWDDWSGGYGHAYRSPDSPNTYHWSENMDARFPRQLIHCQKPIHLYSVAYDGYGAYSENLMLLTNVQGIVEAQISYSSNGYPTFPDGELIAIGKAGWTHLSILNVGNTDAWQISGNVLFTNNTGDQAPCLWPAAVYGSQIVIPTVSGTTYQYIGFDGSVDYGTTSGRAFAVAGNQLWKAAGVKNAVYMQNLGAPNGVLSGANWGATYAVGNYVTGIKTLAAVDDQIFAGTARGLYAGDQTGTFINVLAALGNQIHNDNCRDLAVFENAVVAPHVAGLFAYRPTTGGVEDISPMRSDRSPVTGHIRAVHGYGRWLYAGLYTGSRSYLLAGERKNQRITWHTLQRLQNTTKISRLLVDGIRTRGTLPAANTFWACTDASIDTGGTAPVYFWRMPTLDGNPLMPSPGFSANYIGSARIDFGSTDWDAPGTPKVYRSVEIWSESLASGAQWVDVYYTIDELTRVKLGTVAKSPKDTLFFTTGSYNTGQSIRLSLESFTASYGVTPVYRAVLLRGALAPKYIEEIQAVVRAGDGMFDRQSIEMRNAQQIITDLREMAATGGVYDLLDPSGNSYKVKLLGPPAEEEVFINVGDVTQPEIAATIRMIVMDYVGSIP